MGKDAMNVRDVAESASPLTSTELSVVLRALEEPRRGGFLEYETAIASSTLLVVQCLTSMRDRLDLVLLLVGLAILGWSSLMVVAQRAQARRVAAAIEMVERWQTDYAVVKMFDDLGDPHEVDADAADATPRPT